MNSSAKSRLSSTYRKHLVAVKSRNTICHFKEGGGGDQTGERAYAKLGPLRQSWRRINDDKQVNARRSAAFRFWDFFKTSFITPGFVKRKEAWMAVG